MSILGTGCLLDISASPTLLCVRSRLHLFLLGPLQWLCLQAFISPLAPFFTQGQSGLLKMRVRSCHFLP